MGVEAALLVDVAHVGARGVVRDAQRLLDEGAVASPCQELEDLALAGREPVPGGKLVARAMPTASPPDADGLLTPSTEAMVRWMLKPLRMTSMTAT